MRPTWNDAQVELSVDSFDALDGIVFVWCMAGNIGELGLSLDAVLRLSIDLNGEFVVAHGSGRLICPVSHTWTVEQWRRVLSVFSGRALWILSSPPLHTVLLPTFLSTLEATISVVNVRDDAVKVKE